MTDNPDPYDLENDPEPRSTNAREETIDLEGVMAWLSQAPSRPNLLDAIPEDERAKLANLVAVETEADAESQAPWREWCDHAADMIGMQTHEKDHPWPKASNVRYPLLLTAAMRFNATAYPAVVAPEGAVKCRVHGRDDNGRKAARAERVSAYMSHQLSTVVRNWEPDTDRLLMQVAIAGTMFRKTWFDPASGQVKSRLCRPGAVNVNDSIATLDDAPRISENYTLFPHEIVQRQRNGTFEPGDWWKGCATDDSQAPQEFIEQHRRHDLDGDGYPEPYVVHLHKASQRIVRVAANWRPETVVMGEQGAVTMDAESYYDDYHFMPSPTGGFHGIGLGVLLGQLSETINSSINMLFDAAHMQSMGSGFIGAEARLRGGRVEFRPGEYKQIAEYGDDVRRAVIERPTPGASPVLFQLLGLMIDAGRELANVQDVQAQAQRSNQPATTTLALIEQGMTVYTAVFQRIFRAMTCEFRRIAEINAMAVTPQEYAAFHDTPVDPRADFAMADMDIEPAADPRAVTRQQKMARAQLAMELAAQGLVDKAEAVRMVIDAAGFDNAEALLPKPTPETEMAARLAAEQAELATRNAHMRNIKLGLEIAGLEAKAALTDAQAVKTMAEAEAADEMRPVEIAERRTRLMKDDAGRTGRMAGKPADAGSPVGAQGSGAPASPVGLGGLLGDGGGRHADAFQGQGMG